MLNIRLSASFLFLCFSSLAFFRNLGGESLYIPFNSLIFIGIVFFIFFSLFDVFSKKKYLSNSCLKYLSFTLVLIVISSLVAGVEDHLSWFYRFFYIVSGFFLLFSLLQEKLKITWMLGVILITIFLHTIAALLQYYFSNNIVSILPVGSSGGMIGIFQQVNVLASAAVLGVCLSMYSLIHIKEYFSPFLNTIALFLIFTGSLVVFISGSRLGLLAYIICIPLIFISGLDFMIKNRRFLLLVLFMIFSAISISFITSDSTEEAYSKVERLTEDGKDIRPIMYRLSWELFKDAPIVGHGIGSFSRVFHEKVGEQQLLTGDLNLLGGVRYSHPHNEVLFWAVEGGSVALFGLLILGLTVISALYRRGWKKGSALLSLITPISLHCLVELPFYLSVYHWFLFIFIIYLLVRDESQSVDLISSDAASNLMKFISVIFVVISLMFFISSFYISQRLPKIMYAGEGSVAELYKMRHHPFFSDISMRYTYRSLSENEQKQGGEAISREYVQWMESYVKRIPDIGIYIDLMHVYGYLNEKESQKRVADRALYLFPGNLLIINKIEDLGI